MMTIFLSTLTCEITCPEFRLRDISAYFWQSPATCKLLKVLEIRGFDTEVSRFIPKLIPAL